MSTENSLSDDDIFDTFYSDGETVSNDTKESFSEEELKNIIDELRNEQERLRNKAESLKKQSLTRPDEENYGEIGTDLNTRLTELNKASKFEALANEIEESIKNIHNGSFGICSNCGCKIPITRLLKNPSARYCIACQKKIEQESQMRQESISAPDRFNS